MNSSRRSIFGLFGAALATGGAALTTVPAKAEPRQRKFINGKLICKCDAPEYDETDEPEMVSQSWGSHTHPSPYPSGAHTHSISEGSYTPSFTTTGAGNHSHGISFAGSGGTFTQKVLRPRTTHYCVYCGGIEAPKAETSA